MLFTHCNTRGFWIHCPWELPHQDCFRAFARTQHLQELSLESEKRSNSPHRARKKSRKLQWCEHAIYGMWQSRSFQRFNAIHDKSLLLAYCASWRPSDSYTFDPYLKSGQIVFSDLTSKMTQSWSKKMQRVYHVHKIRSTNSHCTAPRHLEKSMFSYLVDGIACGCSLGVSSLHQIRSGRSTGIGWNRSHRISQEQHNLS